MCMVLLAMLLLVWSISCPKSDIQMRIKYLMYVVRGQGTFLLKYKKHCTKYYNNIAMTTTIDHDNNNCKVQSTCYCVVEFA